MFFESIRTSDGLQLWQWSTHLLLENFSLDPLSQTEGMRKALLMTRWERTPWVRSQVLPRTQKTIKLALALHAFFTLKRPQCLNTCSIKLRHQWIPCNSNHISLKSIQYLSRVRTTMSSMAALITFSIRRRVTDRPFWAYLMNTSRASCSGSWTKSCRWLAISSFSLSMSSRRRPSSSIHRGSCSNNSRCNISSYWCNNRCEQEPFQFRVPHLFFQTNSKRSGVHLIQVVSYSQGCHREEWWCFHSSRISLEPSSHHSRFWLCNSK